jgi:hypothetical protein
MQKLPSTSKSLGSPLSVHERTEPGGKVLMMSDFAYWYGNNNGTLISPRAAFEEKIDRLPSPRMRQELINFSKPFSTHHNHCFDSPINTAADMKLGLSP